MVRIRKHHRRRLPLQMRLFLPLLSALLFAQLSCDEDKTTEPCPPGTIGAVEGFLRAGGVPAVATIGARCGAGVDYGAVMFEVRSDSAGWYRLEVPVGPYLIEVEPSRARIYPVRDTIHVGSGVQRLDIHQGRGIVRLRFPEPLVGQWITVALADRFTTGMIDPTGWAQFEFPILDPGPTPIQISDFRSFGLLYLPGVRNRDDAALFDVPADRIFTLEDSLGSLATIAGFVRGSWQEISELPPSVKAYTASDSTLLAEGSVQQDGRFTLALLRPEPVKLLCTIFTVDRWFGGEGTFATATIYDPGPGGAITDAIHTESGIEIRPETADGVVKRETKVLVRDEAGRTWLSYVSSVTNSICNLPPGRYYVHAQCWCSGDSQEWAAQWYDGAADFAMATPIDLGEGEAASITMRLQTGAKITGRVLGADGDPAAGSWLGILDSDKTPMCESQLVDDDGTFEIHGLNDGTYFIYANKRWAPPWFYPGTANPDSAAPIVILGGISVSGIEWRLPASAGRTEQ